MDIESILTNVYSSYLHAPAISGSLLACYISQIFAFITLNDYVSEAKAI